tara:strand:+ start:613 stop:810 length:198 start_codon:yes stop_codon:yes gene_type:complete
MDIKFLVEKKKKTPVNITIDKGLLNELNEYRDKHNIKQLSPLINEMLWEWIKNDNAKMKKGETII